MNFGTFMLSAGWENLAVEVTVTWNLTSKQETARWKLGTWQCHKYIGRAKALREKQTWKKKLKTFFFYLFNMDFTITFILEVDQSFNIFGIFILAYTEM